MEFVEWETQRAFCRCDHVIVIFNLKHILNAYISLFWQFYIEASVVIIFW